VIGSALALSGNDKQAVLGQQILAGLPLEVAPDVVGTAGKDRILRAFAASDTGNPRLAVRRAELVRWFELVQPKHRSLAQAELVKRSRAHRAKAEDNGVENPVVHLQFLLVHPRAALRSV
jgi:hypothetical protein